MVFPYSNKDLAGLKARDEKLAQLIEQVGLIEREVDENFFDSLIHQIIGQQISNKALATIHARLKAALAPDFITPETLARQNIKQLQACGIAQRKAKTILAISNDIVQGELDLESLAVESDEKIIEVLTDYKGIGRWTVEMVLLFGLKRMDVFSGGDLAIQKGLKLLYGAESLSRDELKEFQERFSPYGSLASLYLWHLAAHPELLSQ